MPRRARVLRIVVSGTAVALSILAACLAPPPSIAHDLGHALAGGVAFGSAVLVVSFLYHLTRHELLAHALGRRARPGTLGGQTVMLVDGLRSPLVAGLFAPRIYCPPDLADRLDADEQQAVVLHEQHHVRDGALMRLVALSTIAPLLTLSLAGRAWLERQRARVEIAADFDALARGATRPVIASALLKLWGAPAPMLGLGFATAADLRIRALLGEPTGLEPDRGGLPRQAAAAVLGAACLVAFLS